MTITEKSLEIIDTSVNNSHNRLSFTNKIPKIITISVLINIFLYIIYYVVLQSEITEFQLDLKRVNTRLLQNSYSRFTNELNIMIQTSIDIHTSTSKKCLIFSSMQYFISSDSILFDDFTSLFDNNYYDTHFDFYINKYRYFLRQKIGLFASLDKIVEYLDNKYYHLSTFKEKNRLRGFHSNLESLRREYDFDMNQKTYLDIPNEIEQKTTQFLITKITQLILNPAKILCNSLTNQETINFQNFQQNFITINGIAIKDWSNHIFHPENGLIATRIQNIIIKSFYTIISIICVIIFKFIKQWWLSKTKRI